MDVVQIIPPRDLAEIEERLKLDQIQDWELKEIYKILLASTDYEKNHPIECYEPITSTKKGEPHQLGFHQSTVKRRAIFGGNQSGKTQAGSFEVAFHFTNQYPAWYPAECRLPKENRGRILVKDFPKSVGEVLEPALMRAISPGFISEVRRNNKGFLTKLKSTTGAEFDIVTHDMDTLALEGWQGDWFWMDEPPPRDKYVALIRGLIRRAGRWWLTCTPLTEPWMLDEVLNKKEIFSIIIDIRDNPYLSEEEVLRFEDSLTEDEKESRLHGKFLHLAGLVFKEFDPLVHIRPSTSIIPKEWPTWCVCDPHNRRPFFFIWLAVDPLDRIWIYDEWPQGKFHEMNSSSRSLKDYMHILMEKEFGRMIYRRIIDGRAGKAPLLVGTQSGEHQDTLIDAFDDLSLKPPFEPSYICQTLGVTDPGHQKVKEYLRVAPATNEPNLFVLENCTNVIYSFQHNTWEEDKEKQAQFAKDPLDCIKYGLMDNPHWIEPNDWQPLFQTQSQPKWVGENRGEVEGGFGYGGQRDY